MPDDSPDPPDGDAPEEDARDDQPTVSIGSEGYQPDADDATGEEGADQRTTAGAENAIPTPESEFGWRGWVLVGVLVLALVVFPVLVALRPVWLFGFRTTYLVLPLIPAFLLGATAVWVAVRSRQG